MMRRFRQIASCRSRNGPRVPVVHCHQIGRTEEEVDVVRRERRLALMEIEFEFNQARSMLLARSVRPARWMKIVSTKPQRDQSPTFTARAACAAARRATGTRYGDALT